MKKNISFSTLCYLEKDGQYLMLHRTMKKQDVNRDKWIGVGGHFEEDESPEECLLREVKEETGYTLTSYRFRGLVTFVSGKGVTEYMSLFTADGFEGRQIPCDEGELVWIDKDRISTLNLWEGDRIFFRLLESRQDFFSLKLVYDGQDCLQEAILDGKQIDLCAGSKESGSRNRNGAVCVRKAEQKDLQDLLNIYNYEVCNGISTLDLHPKTLEQQQVWLESHNREHHPLIVAELDGHVAGYASLSSYREKEAYCSTVELSVYVSPGDRNRGIATVLMTEILREAVEDPDIHMVVSVITTGNDVSTRLHEKFGFSFSGRIPEVGMKFGRYLSIDHYSLQVSHKPGFLL